VQKNACLQYVLYDNVFSDFDKEGHMHSRGMSEEEAAKYIGIPQNSLRQGRCDGPRPGRMPIPPFVRLGRRIIYLRDDLDKWLEDHRVA